MKHTKTRLLNQSQQMLNIAEFVVTENIKHHTDEKFPDCYENDIAPIYREEMNYLGNSQFFAIKNEYGEIMGTIRSLKWDYLNLLPIQKMFGIDPMEHIKGHPVNEIWHIGRFAIVKGARDICLLKKLMVYAISPICEHKDNVAFAECDAKLLRIMTLMGIKTEIIGASINYLGSETIPVIMFYNGLIDFHNENKYLIENESCNQVLIAS